ncbi:Ral guanine nucleotide dissociation stimulator-like 1 [Acipenser ruthenus]|uniref:Ral guanine nucleotide dissociation stimulator-like 1 n=1 Tax=Acipenser ruthenus TaxID=7906 RepID=A0A444V5V8_ACIRT|nr:Ral guanine nucleotide dissociation stimulator-like 1 [Acipenser ruthenus]
MQGTIPYLGTFLTDLVMMDTAMKDHLEEFEVIAQIKLLQSACNNYNFVQDSLFVEWLSGLERLSEAESYSQSCEIEPLSESASNTLKAKKNTGIIKRWSDSDVEEINISFVSESPDTTEKKSSTQEIGEEVEEGAVYTITLRKVQVHQAASKGQRWLGVETEAALSLYETCKVRTIKAGTLEKLVEYLVSAFRGNDSTYVTIFLCTYRSFASTKQVLDLLLNRYAKLHHHSSAEGSRLTGDDRTELKNTISSILGAWLDQYSDDFWKPPEYGCLLQLISYLHLNFPGSDLERRACNLLAQACTFTMLEENGYEEERPDFLSFSQDVVAEQFTLLDAELFKKVVPYQCLGSTWSQRDKKGKEHLAPTIRATVTQFNNVTNCVISTCLSDKTLKPTQRAKILERWIEVARECRILKNFSSLRAILSALQCNSIHRLKKTWDEVSRENFRIFHELSEIFSDENNHSLSRELLIKEGTSKFATLEINPKRAQKRQQQQRELGPPATTLSDVTLPLLREFPLSPAYRHGDALNRYQIAEAIELEYIEHAEADTFFCFTSLMSENRDNFIKSLDDSQCGITYKMESVYATLKQKDAELYLKLQEQNIKPQYFTFRWLTLLLSQEFLLPDVIRIWDSLFSDQERFDFLILVCCAMLVLIRDQLLAGDFTVNMRLLQDYPICDVHTILKKAKDLQDGA